MGIKRLHCHWLLVLIIFYIVLDYTAAQRKKFQDRTLEAENEYDELEAYLKDKQLNGNEKEQQLADAPIHEAKSRRDKRRHRHNRYQSSRHSKLETSVSAVEENTYFRHRTKPTSVHEQRLFDWDDGTAARTTPDVPSTTEAIKTRSERFRNRNSQRKMTPRLRNQDHLRNLSEPSTFRPIDASQLRTRKSTHKALEQSGYESVTYPPSQASGTRRFEHYSSSRYGESSYRQRGSSANSRHQTHSYPTPESYTTERSRSSGYGQHHTRQRQHGEERRYSSEEYYQPGQHSRPSTYDQRREETDSRGQQRTPRYEDSYHSRSPHATFGPYHGHERTTPGTVWGNRSVEGGSYFEKDYDDTHSPVHTSARRPPPRQPVPSQSGLDIDTLVDREAIYGRYSPGDLQDLGIDIDDLPRRNVSIEDTMHPFALLYRPGGRTFGRLYP